VSCENRRTISRLPLKKTLFENSFYVPAAVKDGDHLQGLCLWPIDDEVRIHREELHRLVGQVLAPVSRAWRSSQENDSVANNGFHSIRDYNAALLLDIPPDLDKIESGFRRKDVARAHSGLDFNSAR